jgi:predicted nuclease of predicted toxin-antitoxin system
MRVLLDNNLSERLIPILAEQSWDVTHVRALGLRDADDEVVMETARQDDRILISADTDFGALLATSHAATPSVVLVRRVSGRRVEDLAAILLANLPGLEADLAKGAIVAIGEDSLRVRSLPIG